MRSALIAAALAAMAGAANAGTVVHMTVRIYCDTRDAIAADIAEKFHEHRSAGGIAEDDALFELWRAADGRTWRWTVTNPDGRTCVIAAGQDWREFVPPVPGEKS